MSFKSLIIFAGAGASRGVSQDKYPMALDFRKRLPAEITSHPLFQMLLEHLSVSGEADDLDIEHILWELGRLSGAINAWTDPKNFAASLLVSNRLESILRANISGPGVHSQFTGLKGLTDALQDQINERVYNFYAKLPSNEELERTWIPLLQLARSQGFDRIDIVTTNYDLVIEAALRSVPAIGINTAINDGMYPSIDVNVWRANDSAPGLLTKLHGSVDWKLGTDSTESEPVIRRGHPEFDGNHEKRLILYPGFKGIPSREPFISFHKYFSRILRGATHVLFIGFAFRDDHINELIKNNLTDECKVPVVNPAAELPAISFLDGARHFQQGFGIDKFTTILASSGVAPLSMTDLDIWFKEH